MIAKACLVYICLNSLILFIGIILYFVTGNIEVVGNYSKYLPYLLIINSAAIGVFLLTKLFSSLNKKPPDTNSNKKQKSIEKCLYCIIKLALNPFLYIKKISIISCQTRPTIDIGDCANDTKNHHNPTNCFSHLTRIIRRLKKCVNHKQTEPT